MKYAALGGALGLLAGPMVGVGPGGLWVSAALGAVLVYGLSCLLRPYRVCPWCSDRRRRGDGDGNYRNRNCPACGDRKYVRFGARLMGRGSDD